jgi:hypothetical protein
MTEAVNRGVFIAFILLAIVTAVVLTAILGGRPDPRTEQFLQSLSLEGSLKQSRLCISDGTDEMRSPLVQAAKAFALYLNPPAKAKPTLAAAATKGAPVSPETKTAGMTPEVRPVASSPKFELQGISYHRSRPERSMALVWQPDTGRRWVRPGEQLGHLVIEQINSDAIVYRDGQLTQELALDLDAVTTAVAQDTPAPKRPAGLPAGVSAAGQAKIVAQHRGLSSGKQEGARPGLPVSVSTPSVPRSSARPVAQAIAAERRRWARIPLRETVVEQDWRSRPMNRR